MRSVKRKVARRKRSKRPRATEQARRRANKAVRPKVAHSSRSRWKTNPTPCHHGRRMTGSYVAAGKLLGYRDQSMTIARRGEW